MKDLDKVRFIALDLDGTLLDSDKRVPDDFEDFVISHPDILFAIASGRQYYALLRDFSDLIDRLVYIADNGSFVFRNSELIWCDHMSKEMAADIYELFRERTIILCGRNSAYMDEKDNSYKYVADMYYGRLEFRSDIRRVFDEDDIGKIAIYYPDRNAKEEFKRLPSLPDGITACVSGDEWIDISLISSSKGRAVREVLESCGIRKDEAMAFGDYMNDYSMFSEVKYGIAMANACDELREAAYFITDDNDHDGVMKVLYMIDSQSE